MIKLDKHLQDELLDQSIKTYTNLSDILSNNGLTYDDLRYNDSFAYENPTNTVQYEKLDDIVPYNNAIPAVSFFSGAGGLDIGFKYAGFNNIISIEINELFCDTLRLNDPNKIVIGPPNYVGDISDRETIANLLRENGVDENFQGVFHGGPPCQSFSIAANQRFNKNGDNFKRTGFHDKEKGMLIFDYIWFIKEFRPLAFLIENVEGITEFEDTKKITESLDELRNMGYTIPHPQVMDAAYYSVPQHRRRWIVIGTRGHNSISYPTPNLTAMSCGPIFSRSLNNVSNHITREHKAESIKRYVLLKFGQRDQKGRVDRLNPYKPSKTVIAGGLKGGGRSHLHPFIPRTLSVRECARLQTFPDSYVFTGTTARQFTQVGNAVPPMLAYKLALKIKESILADI